MKTKSIIFKSAFMLACVLTVASCKSKEDPTPTPAGPKATTLTADIPAGSTRSLSADTVYTLGAQVQVSGTINIAAGTVTAENTQEVNSANVALTTTPVIVDSFNQSVYRSAKYMATTTAASSAEFAEFAMVLMGATAAVSNVNRVITGSTLTMFIANISGTTVRLWANTVTGTANIKLQKTYFVV